MKSRKRYADTSESSERKDTDTEDETIPRTQVRKPRSKRNKEKCIKEEYSTSDSDADMNAVYRYVYGSDEEHDGEPAGGGSNAMVLRPRAKGHPVIGRNLTAELTRATMLPINLKWTFTEIYRTLHLIFNKSV